MKNKLKKEAFLSYIYGYLNLVHVNQMRMPDNLTWREFKEFKINEIGSYIGLSKRQTMILKPCIYFHSLEIVISYIIVVVRFLYCLIVKLFLHSRPLDNKILIVDEGYPQEDLIGKTEIEKNNVIKITIPFTGRNKFRGVRHVNLLTNLRHKDLYKSLVWSLQLMTYMNKKFRNRDIFLRYYSSFEYFMAYLFSRNVSSQYTFLFISTYSRWAYLNGGLRNNKTFIQHGFLSGKWTLMKKLGFVENAYYINNEQRKICEKMLFNNIPSYKFQNKMSFTIFLTDDNLSSVLIIGNTVYNKQEEEIISKLSNNKSLLLLIKPHPKTKNLSFYYKMKSLYGITILNREDYPKVDYVISYNSTLATQYEDVGLTVYRYSDVNFDNEMAELEHINRKENASNE